MRKTLKTLGLLILLLFLATSVELHADDDREAASEAHCSVTCCPSHHLGPRVSPTLSLSLPSLDRSFVLEDREDPSTQVLHSVFHPPKAALA